MSDKNIVEDLRIMARVVDESQGEATVTMLSGSLFDEAADEIELLQEEINDLRLQVVALSSPLVPAEPVEKTDLMPRTKNFSELRDEARRDPKRARRIDEAKERALEEISAYGDRQSEEISNVEDELEDAADEIQKLRDAGDLLAQGIRTGRWDEALEAWDDARRN